MSSPTYCPLRYSLALPPQPTDLRIPSRSFLADMPLPYWSSEKECNQADQREAGEQESTGGPVLHYLPESQ